MDLNAFYTVIIALFIMIIIGFIARKVGIINEGISKALSSIVLKIGQPFMIIGALIGVDDLSTERLASGFAVLGLGIAFHVVIALVAHFCVFKFKNVNERKITEFAIIFGNCGFIGFPLVESVMGAEGLFYASFFLISFNIFMWTWGLAILARKREDIKLSPKTMVLNYGTLPCIIALSLYVIIFLVKLKFPDFAMPEYIALPISYIGNLCTPISMLITGSLIATVSLKELFCNLKVYYACAIRLVVAPAIIVLLTWLFGLDKFIVFMGIVFAMPTASGTVMFGELYEIEKKRAAVICGVSSLLSMLTMPLLMYLLSIIFV